LFSHASGILFNDHIALKIFLKKSQTMGNKQHQALEETPSSYVMEVDAETPTHKQSRLSMESVAAEISLDGTFVQTGVATPSKGRSHERRISSAQFLGAQGDQAVADSPRSKKQPKALHSRTQSVPQQVLKFEQQSELFLFLHFFLFLSIYIFRYF